MEDNSPSEPSVNAVLDLIYFNKSKAIGPNPIDFDTFLPWACKQYNIDADVIVTRGVRISYGSLPTNKKHAMKRKASKQPAMIIAQDSVLNEEFFSSDIDAGSVNKKIVSIETVYDSHENLVQLKFLKNKDIPRIVIQVIALTIPYQNKLTSITINCGLGMESLYEISKCLPNSQIIEICLDDTFLNPANYYILLTHGKLKHLSLARCSINDAVINTIADQLKEPFSSSRVLSTLNLSTNRITDIGAKYLADMLRTNRQLSYLNLAGNMITDEGGVSILDTLQKFRLRPVELLESRNRYVAYLKTKNKLTSTFILELQTAAFGKINKKKITRKAKLESQSLQQHYELLAEAQLIQKKAEYLAENKLGMFIEPFSLKNTEIQDGLVYCFGNNTLCYLNLAYNNLTYVSVKKLLEVLKTQKSLNRTPGGLIKVLIAGNLMPAVCDEFEEINNILRSGMEILRKQSEAATKKKSLNLRSAR